MSIGQNNKIYTNVSLFFLVSLFSLSFFWGCAKKDNDSSSLSKSDNKKAKKVTHLVIPFEKLGPRCVRWQKNYFEKGILGYYAAKHGDAVVAGVMPMGSGSISFDEYGMPVAPTADSSIIAFATNGLKLVWLNNVTFVSDSNTTLYFAVIKNEGGLAHLYGNGKCIMSDGEEKALIMKKENYEQSLNFVSKLLKSTPQDSDLIELEMKIQEQLNKATGS